MARPVLSAIAISTLIFHAWAFQFISQNSRPDGILSQRCFSALSADLDCIRQVGKFLPGTYRPADVLEEACTTQCSASLIEYESSVEAACSAEDVYMMTATHEAPASFIPTMLSYNFRRTCITDGGRWCNAVAYESSLDSGEGSTARIMGNASEGAAEQSSNTTAIIRRQQANRDPCDNCIIKQLQFEASSPLYQGELLVPVYSSLTSSCSKTGFPLSTLPTPFPTVPVSTGSPSTCNGTTYDIRDSDTCDSVAASQGISTAWLLYDNDLEAFCADFPDNGTLCLRNKCSTYQVKMNDTCASIAKSQRVTETQLVTWNPILGTACTWIERSADSLICVSPPGDGDFTQSPTTTVPPFTGTGTPTAVPVPADVANGTTDKCALYYRVQPDDYCNLLVVKYSISIEDFRFLNQGVNENCTNLFALESYCVKSVGPVNEYTNHPDYVKPPVSTADVPYDSLPKATYTPSPITDLPDNGPLANGTRSDCLVYADGANLTLPFDISNTFFDNMCDLLAHGWRVTLEQLANWNPSLVNESGDCTPEAGQRYCMAAYEGSDTIANPTPSLQPLPLRDGSKEDCENYQSVVSPMTCAGVLAYNNITTAQFYEWNPAVGPECGNLWTGYRYCVRADLFPTSVPPSSDATPETTAPSNPSTASLSSVLTTMKLIHITTGPTSNDPPTPTGVTPPGPTQEGIAADCNEYHLVEAGDGCYNIAVEYGISLDDFYKWNPAITNDCGAGFWVEYAYCVGVSS